MANNIPLKTFVFYILIATGLTITAYRIYYAVDKKPGWYYINNETHNAFQHLDLNTQKGRVL
jgi:hypothetical protein